MSKEEYVTMKVKRSTKEQIFKMRRVLELLYDRRLSIDDTLNILLSYAPRVEVTIQEKSPRIEEEAISE